MRSVHFVSMGDAKAGRDRGGRRFQFAPKLEGFALAFVIVGGDAQQRGGGSDGHVIGQPRC